MNELTLQSSTSQHADSRRIAYLMSRFPKISETFVLYEILELERLGIVVDIFPLVRERERVVHAEANAFVERAQYSKPFDTKVLLAVCYWLSRRPLAYLQLWAQVLAGNLGSPKFLVRALIVLLQASWFARRMRELSIEHMHAHFATHATLAAYIVSRLTGISYSFTAHADDIYVEQAMLGEKLRDARFVVTISDYNRRFLVDRYKKVAADKVVVIHCGVDSAVFRPRPLRATNDTLALISVARLEEKKGHTYLLDACARLRDAGVQFVCRLVGDGELRPQLEQQVQQLNLTKHVVFLGRQPRDRVEALLAEADAMILPSITTVDGKQEGIPVALMEAMAMELPVVSTAISGIPELIKDGQSGLLVPERDSVALATALLRLRYDPELGRRLGAAGRAEVLREFDLQTNTATLAAYFQRLRMPQPLRLQALEEAI